MKINLRLSILLALFALAYLSIHFAGIVQETPIRRPLSEYPLAIGDWRFIRNNVLSSPVVDMLGVADYISYDYRDQRGRLLNLYVSYFTAVGVKGGYHSPQNCMPGGGWNIVSIQDVPLSGLPDSIKGRFVKKAVVQKGSERQLVLYWFQNRGRLISSEYWEKIYLVLDAVFKRRRDGSFIRIVAPVPEAGADHFEEALLDFARETVILADEFIPGA